MDKISIVKLTLLVGSLAVGLLVVQVENEQSPVRLKAGPVLLESEVANIEIAFADLNRDKKPDLVVGSQWHVWDEEESKFKRTKISVDGNSISIHFNQSAKAIGKDKVAFAEPVWPMSNKDPLFRLPFG